MSPCQWCGRRSLTLLFAWCALVWLIGPSCDDWTGVNAGRWLAFPLEWGMAQASIGARLGCWMAFISGPEVWPDGCGGCRFGVVGLGRMAWNGPWRHRAIGLVWT